MRQEWWVCEGVGGSKGDDDDEAQLEAVLDSSQMSAIYTININVGALWAGYSQPGAQTILEPQLESSCTD